MRIDDSLTIDERCLEERFVRSSGPGGQNVNKVSTAVELRFDLRVCDVLSASERARLERLAGRRMTDEGVLVIRAERFRTQERNRDDARERLSDLIRTALIAPKHRVATKPTRASRTRRLDSKAKRGTVKRMRQSRDSDD
jgi:ribosome-associated protein